jgi:hypothetical protein
MVTTLKMVQLHASVGIVDLSTLVLQAAGFSEISEP